MNARPSAAFAAPTRRGFLVASCGVAATGLGGCAALPRSGPLASDIDNGEDAPNGLVADLTAETAARIPATNPVRFSHDITAADVMNVDMLGVGDVVEITIWEGGETALFGGAGGPAALSGIVVGDDGALSVPFVGPVRVVGLSPTAAAERIRLALSRITLDPQVLLRVSEARSRTVSVQGAVTAPGLYTIGANVETLLPLLALAGGADRAPEEIEVTVRRGGAGSTALLRDIYADPSLDIALRSGDVVLLTPLRERFVILGATTIQAQLPFPERPLSLLSALGVGRGLLDFDADPRAVFLFRLEDRALADRLLEGPQPADLPAGLRRPIVYRLDLTRPDAIFVAQQFEMRDGDAILVSNAPLTELRKIIQLFTSTLAPIQATSVVAP